MTARTPHFRVHYPQGYEATAIDAIAVAEEAYERVSSEVGHAPEAPIHLVLMDTSDLSDGFTEVAYYGRVVIFPAFPVGMGYSTGISPRMEDWLRLVITHELVHAVHLDMHDGPITSLRQLFGHIPYWSTPNANQPAAFLEGYATLLETRLVEGGRGEAPFFDMFFRAAALEGPWLRPDQALGRYDLERWVPGGSVYLYGYGLLDFIARTYGTAKLREIQDGYASTRFSRPGQALEAVLGEDLEAVWEAWTADLYQRAQQVAQQIEAEGVTGLHLLPSFGEVVTEPTFSPDGRSIAYASEGRLPALRLIGTDGSGDRQLSLGYFSAPGGLGWLPGGEALAASRVDYADPTRTLADLVLVDAASGKVSAASRGQRAYAPAVSPADGRVAFAVRERLNARVMVTGPLTAGTAAQPEVLWEPPEGVQVLSMAWSPDGRRLAVAAWAPGEGADLYLLEPPDPSGKAPQQTTPPAVRRLTQDRAVDDRPAWSPDGRYLLFHSDRSGVYNLYALEMRTGRLFRLTNVLYGAFDPDVSPDGRQIALVSYTPDGYRLATLGWDEARWERWDSGWDGGLAGGATSPAAQPPEQQDAGAARARRQMALRAVAGAVPYQPWPSLRPTYWLPAAGLDEQGLQLGVATSGMDALAARAYSLNLRLGIPSLRPAWDLTYAQLAGPFKNLTLSVGMTRDSIPESADDDSPWYEATTLSAAGVLSFPRAFSALEAGAGFDRVQVRPLPTGAGDTSTEAWLGVQYGVVGGHEDLVRSDAVGLEGRWLLEGGLGSAVAIGSWRQAWTFGNPPASVRLALDAGLSAGQTLLRAGGDRSPFRLRSQLRGAVAGLGVVSGGVEYRHRLATFLAGAGDGPLFFHHLDLAVFSEGILAAGGPGLPAAGPRDSLSWAVAAGAELRLQTDQEYGNSSLIWRIGYSRTLWGDGVGGGRIYVGLGP